MDVMFRDHPMYNDKPIELERPMLAIFDPKIVEKPGNPPAPNPGSVMVVVY